MPVSATRSRQSALEEIVEAAPTRTSGRRPSPKARAEQAEFLRTYYRLVPLEELRGNEARVLAQQALHHRSLAEERANGTATVRVFNPGEQDDGWSSERTIVQIVTDDMPFLVDSVVTTLGGFDRGVHVIIHPQLAATRSVSGALTQVAPPTEHNGIRPPGTLEESWMHVEVDRLDEAELAEAEQRLHHVLENVRNAVEDWPKMRAHALTVASELRTRVPAGTDPAEATEAARFLEWLAQDNFTFLGYRQYALSRERGKEVSRAVPSTGLGLMRYDKREPDGVVLSREATHAAHDGSILIITKANSRSTIHRDAYLDYISIKTFDQRGRCDGEMRFLGLYASAAYNETIRDIPLLDVKAKDVLRLAELSSESHSGKDIWQILETYPRDELFQTSADDLVVIATGVLTATERRRTRLFLRADDFGRFMSCLVYIPRDRYTTTVRLRIQQLLLEAFDGTTIDYTTRVSESAIAQLHFVVRVASGVSLPTVDAGELESRIIEATRTWEEDLADALERSLGPDAAAPLLQRYGRALPEAYKEDFSVDTAVADLVRAAASDEDRGGRTGLFLYREPDGPATERRFKLYGRESLTLTRVLPLFTHLGVEVTDERPYELPDPSRPAMHIYDFGLRAADPSVWGDGEDGNEVRDRFECAFRAVWEGQAESDGFNALVLSAQLGWRQVVILRTVAKYLRQTGSTFSQDYLEAALVANPAIARDLVRLFELRFEPTQFADTGDGRAARDRAEKAAAQRIVDSLESVASLDQDRIVRAILGTMRATLRTNFYQPDAAGDPKPYVSLKLDPKKVPGLPAPRPMFEIWVYSPQVEGVHLRFGKVARGGLRWSDRREDFRTEILGLVKAQMVKNAVIVPTGSKGGFFAKQLPDPAADRDAWMAEGIASYRVFLSGLLDVTDNLVDGTAVAPRDVVRHDPDDTYLVVAADKGTASFSDIANAISADYGFWLDDAFASGGSAGYDHKGMGITARGAWESVKRHFREMGVDTQSEEFTVVGVGDMSGDVFGNGMLLSEHIRLVAAFDHRHIFVDPTPDAATSFAERRRLFELPRSSWADYDPSLISAGGGVFPRSAKSVAVTAPMVQALGLRKGTTSLTPAELMAAILRAPVDLLWNGGIGTYVKAQAETNSEIGDRANDAIRCNGKDLRVKVVGEGGNLGMSQLGRIEAAMNGVRVNTDAIDNSAGVDTSDHEVNIKILLSGPVRSGELSTKRRNTLLASMTDEVAEQVLRDNYEQNVLLGNARAQQHAMLTVHERLIQFLESHADLDRALEFLPTDGEIARRQQEGEGLTSPEFAVLVAYSKLHLKKVLAASDVPDDPWFAGTLASYFPAPLRGRYAEQIEAHPLRREIIVNAIANSLVNRGGITFGFRAAEETGASFEQIARAYVVCREVFDLAGFVARVEQTDNAVAASAQTALYLEFRRLLDRAVRWFLSSRPAQLDIASEIAMFRPGVQAFAGRMGQVLRGAELGRLKDASKALQANGVPEALATEAAALLDLFSLLDCIEIAAETGEDLEAVVGTYFAVSEALSIDAMLLKVTQLPREDRWDGLARGALRDDLYSVLEALTRSVLAATARGASPDERFEAWSRLNEDALARARTSLGGIERLSHATIAALSVALRTLRAVSKPTTAPQVDEAAAEAEVESTARKAAAPSKTTVKKTTAKKATAKKTTAKKATARKASSRR